MAKVGHLVKEWSVEELSVKLSKRPNFFITTITRLPAAEADAFRQKLYTSQARLLIIKRRLGQRAIARLHIEGLPERLEGSVGLVLAGEDVLLTAKHLVEFRKGHEEALSVRGAVIEGQLLDTRYVEELATLPPKPILLAHVVSAVESPLADVVFTVERLLGEAAWVVEQLAQRTPAEAESKPTAPQQPPVETEQAKKPAQRQEGTAP